MSANIYLFKPTIETIKKAGNMLKVNDRDVVEVSSSVSIVDFKQMFPGMLYISFDTVLFWFIESY